MADYWKSQQQNYWCEVCRCWIRNSLTGKATHENGPKHREQVERKLREAKRRSDQDEKDMAEAKASMRKIEARAKAQFDKDRAAGNVGQSAPQPSSQHQQQDWIFDQQAGYYYSASLACYYDGHSCMYYYGDKWHKDAPGAKPASSSAPAVADPKPKPAAAANANANANANAAAASVGSKEAGGGGGEPVSRVGGAKAGEAGGKKDKRKVGAGGGSATKIAKNKKIVKRKRPKTAREIEEEKALAAREAARQRVKQRSEANFGFL